MSDTPARLLRLLSILQTGRDWTSTELADRLRVTTRTVRKDIDRLRNLGYQVDSMRGPGGGYWLGRGATTPPLLLDEDEAVAVAIGLRLGSSSSIAGIEETSLRAFVKLQKMLPSRLERRVAALEESLAMVRTAGPKVDADMLVLFSTAYRDRRVVRFEYERHDGESTRRVVEPNRLVAERGRWYLLAWDIERDDWRTFRIDRITKATFQPGPAFEPRHIADAAERVSLGAATAMWRIRVRVIALAPADALIERLPPAVQVEPLDEERCRLYLGSSDPETLAGYLALLGADFSVEDPGDQPELIAALAEMAERFSKAAGAVS